MLEGDNGWPNSKTQDPIGEVVNNEPLRHYFQIQLASRNSLEKSKDWYIFFQKAERWVKSRSLMFFLSFSLLEESGASLAISNFSFQRTTPCLTILSFHWPSRLCLERKAWSTCLSAFIMQCAKARVWDSTSLIKERHYDINAMVTIIKPWN